MRRTLQTVSLLLLATFGSVTSRAGDTNSPAMTADLRQHNHDAIQSVLIKMHRAHDLSVKKLSNGKLKLDLKKYADLMVTIDTSDCPDDFKADYKKFALSVGANNKLPLADLMELKEGPAGLVELFAQGVTEGTKLNDDRQQALRSLALTCASYGVTKW